MRIALGIDTGGTYTDAVLVDHDTGRVLAGAKALTTRHDLAIGIREAVAAVWATQAGAARPLLPGEIVLVGLSTTLATNAMVEGHRGPVCLLLIGYDPRLMDQYGFQRELGTADYVYIQGGHNGMGDELAPLDEAAIREAVAARRSLVEAFAVSGYFSVRNPAHELRAQAVIGELCGLPVTCGHDLSSRLNAVRRATTAALNASLIAPLRELIATVRQTLDERGIAAPLMVVKGDGSLVQAEWAMQRPIETILSGPAASVVGAWHLAGRGDAWVVDVGGTTTDIAALAGGYPTLNAEGARVGGWRTMVQAIDVHTTGLGGDSHVRFDADGRLAVGPRRVVPVSLLAHTHPEVGEHLRSRRGIDLGDGRRPEPVEFALAWRAPAGALSEPESALVQRLAGGPRPVADLAPAPRQRGLVQARLDGLAARGLVQRSAFTPTDALHVLGRLDVWDGEAARLAGEPLAAWAGLDVVTFCGQVVAAVAQRIATELVSKALEDETGMALRWDRDVLASVLLARALRDAIPPTLDDEMPVEPGEARLPGGATPEGGWLAGAGPGPGNADLACTFTLRRPIVAIGAPVTAYLPRVAAGLHTDLVIPTHAEVANAVGAVAGGVIQRVHATISPLAGQEDTLRLFLPDGCHDFTSLEAAAAQAEALLRPLAERLARQAGADHVEVRLARRDHYAPAGGHDGPGQEVYLGTDLTFTATGRPAAARPPAEDASA